MSKERFKIEVAWEDGGRANHSKAEHTQMNLALPVTETPNELTMDIDVATAIEKVRLLRQTDAQLFSGWRGQAGETLVRHVVPHFSLLSSRRSTRLLPCLPRLPHPAQAFSTTVSWSHCCTRLQRFQRC